MFGQHPGRMSRVGRGVIFMSLVFFMFQSILSIFVFLLFLVAKINYFHGWGTPPSSRKIPRK